MFQKKSKFKGAKRFKNVPKTFEIVIYLEILRLRSWNLTYLLFLRHKCCRIRVSKNLKFTKWNQEWKAFYKCDFYEMLGGKYLRCGMMANFTM